MQNTDDTPGGAQTDAKRWELELSARIGQAVAERRKQLGLTGVELSALCAELGYPITRVALSKIENNARAGKFDIAELIVLSAALGTSPAGMVYPGPYDGEIEPLPDGEPCTRFLAAQWFSGIVWSAATTKGRWPTEWNDATEELRIYRRIAELEIARSRALFEQLRDGGTEMAAFFGRELAGYDRRIENLRQQLGIEEPDDA